jgi:hypothetical protein
MPSINYLVKGPVNASSNRSFNESPADAETGFSMPSMALQ